MSRVRPTLDDFDLEESVENTKPNRKVKDAKAIMDNAVVLDITFHAPWLRRKDRLTSGVLGKDVKDKTMLSLTKMLVKSKEFDAINHLATASRAWLAARTLPSPLKRGTYLVPIASIGMISDYLDKIEEKYTKLVNKFLEVYPEQIEKAEENLGTHFDATEYPSVSQLQAAFWIERRLIDFGIPSEGKIGAAFWKAEKERAEQTWTRAVDEIQEGLRESFRTLVAHLAERLEPKADGERKIFRDSAMDNIKEFIELFKTRNITEDAELEGLVIQAQNVLKGKKPDKLRTSSVARGEVVGEMKRVVRALDKLMINAPKRSISFAKEGEE